MLIIIRIVIPRHHIREVVVTFSKQSHFVHIRKTYRPFHILQLILTSFFSYLIQESLCYLNVVYHIQPTKAHFLYVLFKVELVNNSYYAPYHFTFLIVSSVKEGFGIVEYRVLGFVKRGYLVADERRHPIRIVFV